jgi:hypothetical protein
VSGFPWAFRLLLETKYNDGHVAYTTYIGSVAMTKNIGVCVLILGIVAFASEYRIRRRERGHLPEEP